MPLRFLSVPIPDQTSHLHYFLGGGIDSAGSTMCFPHVLSLTAGWIVVLFECLDIIEQQQTFTSAYALLNV